MIDYDRRAPLNHTMTNMYSTPPEREGLEDFAVFKKGSSYLYENYNHHYYECAESDADAAAAVYHSLVNAREFPKDDWRYKHISEYTTEETVTWLVDVAHSLGYTEYQIPFCNFQVRGQELLNMTKDEIRHRLRHEHLDPLLSQRIADSVFEKLHQNEESSVIRYPDSYSFAPDPVSTFCDLDSPKARFCQSDYRLDSSDEDGLHLGSASPVQSYGSEASKSGDEDDKKKKIVKRPPGRPPGSGRKIAKRPRSVSVPEFLRDMLLDPKYCPSIIKWEDYVQGKFRFVKPDEVAKLWGRQKQNDGMTFEKFSRAMRYHYRQSVLVSVPTARLVYQFGVNGPKRPTNDPNFVKLKEERMDS